MAGPAQGKPGKLTFSFTTNEGTGQIEVDASDLFAFGKRIGKNMVSSIEDVGKAALGKVQVELQYYDFGGNKNTLEFLMNEHEFRALKQTLGK